MDLLFDLQPQKYMAARGAEMIEPRIQEVCMRLILTLLVRNNQDIVAANIDYHLAMGVDHVVVTDNLSTDDTRNIVLQYVDRGVATLLDEPADDYNQSVWVTRMALLAGFELAADWVINSDVDEFWWPSSGDLKQTLSSVPADIGVIEARRVNFLPMRAGNGPFWRDMIWREVSSRNALGEMLPGKVAHRAAMDVIVGAGNHSVASATLAPTKADERITIFHFPIRSFEQFRDKIRLGGAAFQRNKQLTADIGHVWRKLYEIEQSGGLSAWYEQIVHGDDPGLSASVAQGEVIEDTKLRDFLIAIKTPEAASGCKHPV
ncbi:glycosyltransferase family 2 protein [uncultured Bradyrhizobium sp.]|uniref:glycosyltransferase family 2 protein n=1 Tax=uncultured Bradyrhizobium sp. TaxID=199684 RepID=UPI0035CBDDFF